MDKSRRLYCLHVLKLATTDEFGGGDLIEIALQYGTSVKITKKELKQVLGMTVEEVLLGKDKNGSKSSH